MRVTSWNESRQQMYFSDIECTFCRAVWYWFSISIGFALSQCYSLCLSPPHAFNKHFWYESSNNTAHSEGTTHTIWTFDREQISHHKWKIWYFFSLSSSVLFPSFTPPFSITISLFLSIYLSLPFSFSLPPLSSSLFGLVFVSFYVLVSAPR